MVANSLSDEVSTRIGDTVIIPVFSGNVGNGSTATFSIIGFLSVKLNSANFTGNQDHRGFNTDFVSYTTAAGTFSNGAVDGGAYAINLVK
jgi:hypothetical protein